MRKVIAGLLPVILIGGCVTTSSVVPVGRDSYMISGRAAGGLNAGKGNIAALQQANAYCAAMNKFAVVRRIDTNGIASLGAESTQLVFSCVTSDDPEYTRPNLQRDPTTIIEDQRKK